jgi:DNA-binding MarR family transcriptional regulator
MDAAMSTNNNAYTEKQGQYLAFIFYYTKINGIPPAQRDFQRYFSVTPPTVHQMILTLEEKKLISRLANKPRSLAICISENEIPRLK